jgi:phosphoglycolate/pyridoxal phosphate phosphatase family enzyme
MGESPFRDVSVDPRAVLGRYGAFLVDVDGVLTRGNDALPGAVEAFAALQARGRALVLTNNSTRSRSELAEHLGRLGFAVSPDDILGSAFLAARYLARHYGPVSVWVLGEDGVRDEMLLSGHRLATRPEDATWVVAGMDRDVTYAKLAQALRALVGGAKILATNEDATFPTADGLVPGAGAIVGALRGMGFAAQHVVGKPSPAAFEVALDVLGLPANRVLMIGDRLDTDIVGAQAAGLDSALVLSGVDSLDDIGRSSVHPTWVAASFAELCAGRGEPSGASQGGAGSPPNVQQKQRGGAHATR